MVAAALFGEREVRLTTLPGAAVRASVSDHECIVVKEMLYAASESFSLRVRDPRSFIWVEFTDISTRRLPRTATNVSLAF